MSMPAWVRARNVGSRPITINLVYPASGKKGSKTRPPIRLTLRPGERSMPFFSDAVAANRMWERLVAEGTIEVEAVDFTPAFVEIYNRSAAIVRIPIRGSGGGRGGAVGGKPPTVVIEPNEKSLVAMRALTRPLKEIQRRFPVDIESNWRIGPPATSRAVGTYADEDVYVCDECGAPIVFRYRPPVPIHI